MFKECLKLTSHIDTIWPANWDSFETINVQNMFYNCSKITGDISEDKLWNSNKTFSASGCFYNCISLDNYTEIPIDWK